MSRSLGLLLALLLVVPTALAHNVAQPVQDDPAAAALARELAAQRAAIIASNPELQASPEDDSLLPFGYTGPAKEPYRSFFEGTWLYGQAGVTPLGNQKPVELSTDGEWLVWEDAARSDIYAFNTVAGQGYYLTNDSFAQHHPKVAHGIVVWQDFRDKNQSAIWMYDLNNSEMRRVSRPGSDALVPQTDGKVIAWTSYGRGGTHVHAYGIANSTEWIVGGTTDRTQDPYIVDGMIAFRTLRFNVWDILAYDVDRDELLSVTTDRWMQSAPFGNGTSLLYLTQNQLGGWKLHDYDADLGRDEETRFSLPSSKIPSISGEHMLLVAHDARYQQLVVRNTTNAITTHVSGNLLLETEPVIAGDHVFAVLRTLEGTRLLDLSVSPFAFSPAPQLSVLTDTSSLPWVKPLPIVGILLAGPSWTAPLTFTYRLDGGAPMPIPANTTWHFTLDPAGVKEGYHTVTIRATFREGPPVTKTLVLMIPHSFNGLDLPSTAMRYHTSVVQGMANFYVLNNPGSWVLLPLLAVLLVVLAYRLFLWARRGGLRSRRRREPEYIAPDADDYI